jgi:hypothetical protein
MRLPDHAGNDDLRAEHNVAIDPNNRPGGPNLIVTAKMAHKVHFLDAATLTIQATIDMPGSTHELVLSADGRTAYGTVYGDGVFAKRVNPDRRLSSPTWSRGRSRASSISAPSMHRMAS